MATETPPPELKPSQPKPATKAGISSWAHLQSRARVIGSLAALFGFLIIVGGLIGYFLANSSKKTATPKTTVQSLSASDISKLTEVGSNLGSSGQTLNIGASALFRGKVDVTGDLSVGGHFNANGPVTLSQLNITGNSALSGLNVGSNLAVAGQSTFAQAVTFNGLVTANGGLNVAGAASFNSINASALAVRSISISGPLSIGHLASQGPTPVFVTGTSVGAGGTANLSGNDTAGTINFNTGNNPPAGVLGTMTFRAAYGGNVHVLLSPTTGAAASTPAYVTHTSGGFQVRTDTPPPAGSNLSFDYFVIQ